MNVCTIWWAAPVSPADSPQLVDLLDAHERERLNRLQPDADQARYLAAHVLTRRVLGLWMDRPAASVVIDRPCICGKPHGKPTLDGGPEFSLTHASNVVGVAVHDQPVGLDVERVRPLPDLPSLAKFACSCRETVTDTTQFFRLWTRKEALLKATGAGLSSPMSAITLGRQGVCSWTGPGAPTEPVWLVDLAPSTRHPAAAAGLGPLPVVHEEDGDALLR
ncbi:MAG: 4'-phosphopantetheinyl transferase superfamily protein [Geodermatophilaceae bacterium]|nr:4'-phosphopantetheinyl transferase superfamily protein [Geodermatophilaceae bacterium]